MAAERIERRVLGALAPLSRATASPVSAPLRVASQQAQVRRNRAGLYVITAAQGLEHHLDAFEAAPAAPAPGSLVVSFRIEDPRGRFLPRQLTLRLPRAPDPAAEDSLFEPVPVLLYPAATAPLSPNWSRIRATLRRAGEPLRGALLRVVRLLDETVIASGISDPRGEALLIVPGVPVTRFAEEDEAEDGATPVVVNRLPVRLEASHRERDWPVDPDELEAEHAADLATSVELALRTGGSERVVLNLT